MTSPMSWTLESLRALPALSGREPRRRARRRRRPSTRQQSLASRTARRPALSRPSAISPFGPSSLRAPPRSRSQSRMTSLTRARDRVPALRPFQSPALACCPMSLYRRISLLRAPTRPRRCLRPRRSPRSRSRTLRRCDRLRWPRAPCRLQAYTVFCRRRMVAQRVVSARTPRRIARILRTHLTRLRVSALLLCPSP